MTGNNGTQRRIEAAAAKTQTLIEALPWIRKFSGKIVVIKCGGHAMVDPQMSRSFAEDIIFLRHAGVHPVIVHGGGPHIDSMLRRLGLEPEFRNGYRVTTQETMEVVRMVLTGQVSRELVGAVNQHGPYAVGLSGEDARLFEAVRMTVTIEGAPANLGLVGEITQVNPKVVEDLLAADRIPIISSIASEAGNSATLNVNADAGAAALAVSLKAEKLLMLTDVAGVYAQWPDESSLISSLNLAQLQELIPRLESGMVPKMQACEKALCSGVPRAHIIDGRKPHSMLLEIFTDAGIGTQITAE